MSELAGRGAIWTEERARGTARRTAAARRSKHVRRAAGQAPLRLVADGGRLVSQSASRPADVRSAPVRTQGPREATVVRLPPAARAESARAAAARTPVRLTRRGRAIVTAVAVLTVGAVSMALAGAAQATGHSGAPAGPGKGVARVLVQPGQNLWSLAKAYDPGTDTRIVIQEILQLNSMATDQLQPGQLLWVPRG
jgi:hypothetical protein